MSDIGAMSLVPRNATEVWYCYTPDAPCASGQIETGKWMRLGRWEWGMMDIFPWLKFKIAHRDGSESILEPRQKERR